MLVKYSHKFNKILYENKIANILLLIISIILLKWINQGRISQLIIPLFFLCYFSYLAQSILLIKKNYFIYIFRAFFMIILCFEIIFGLLNAEKGNTKTIIKQTGYYDYTVTDSILGWKLKPGCFKQRATRLYNGDTVYDVYYSSDEFSRRISEESIKSDTAKNNMNKKHAVFLGCSFTFGQGLNYSSTFPFLFESMHSEFKSYNYGFSNYGPQEFCLFFDEGINTINNSTIPEDSGFCIYTYIDDHMNRVYGGSVYLSNASTNNSPDIYVNENKLVRKKRSNFTKYVSWVLNNSETVKYFNITTTYPKTVKFYKRFAGIINYTAEKYWNIKPCGEFYVSLYPDKYCVTDTSWIKYLNKKIKVLNPPVPIDFETNQNYKIKNDGHPTKELNLYYVNEFSKSIFKNK